MSGNPGYSLAIFKTPFSRRIGVEALVFDTGLRLDPDQGVEKGPSLHFRSGAQEANLHLTLVRSRLPSTPSVA